MKNKFSTLILLLVSSLALVSCPGSGSGSNGLTEAFPLAAAVVPTETGYEVSFSDDLRIGHTIWKMSYDGEGENVQESASLWVMSFNPKTREVVLCLDRTTSPSQYSVTRTSVAIPLPSGGDAVHCVVRCLASEKSLGTFALSNETAPGGGIKIGMVRL